MKKIGVVNRTNLKNYGSVLQVYALCNVVKKLGYDAEVVWQSGNLSKNFDIRPNKLFHIGIKLLKHPSLALSMFRLVKRTRKVVVESQKSILFEDFVTKNFEQIFYTPNEIEKIATSDKYYKFICGSDQVWATTTLYPDPMMYLRFAPRAKRIAYAPSLGRDYIPNYNKNTIRKYIKEIDNVSIREDTGRTLLKELTGRDVPVVADPTLLMHSYEWDELKAKVKLPNHYTLCYFLDEPADEVKIAICKYVKENNKKVVILGNIDKFDLPTKDVIRPAAGPAEFLTIMSKADMVITDSYHGMLFAINYHRKFWSVERNYSQYDQSSRQLTILSRLHLEDRYVKGDYNFTDVSIDYDYVQARINEFVKFSMDYLKSVLR